MSPCWDKIRRADFPITKKSVYLDHASGGPIPLPVAKKIQTYYDEHVRLADYSWPKWIAGREKVRARVAKFINAEPGEITFIQSTSQGMNYVAELLVDEGTVLTNTCEFPSSTLPWIWRGAKMVWQEPEKGVIRAEVGKDITVRTILTSFVQYATGFRQDLEAVGKRKGNRYFVVNATQGFGAFPINVQQCKIDFLMSNSYKWLMAGYGGGVLYINRKWIRKFKPADVGWRSMRKPEGMANRKIDLKDDASRYEMGCPSFPTIFGVGAAVDYLSGIGMEKISQRILELTDFAIQGLERKGCEIISPREPKHRSGIVIFKPRHPKKTWKKLLRSGVYTSLRGEGIRLAPHFYNNYEDIERLLRSV